MNQNKKKNVAIIILVITTLILGVYVLYLQSEANKYRVMLDDVGESCQKSLERCVDDRDELLKKLSRKDKELEQLKTR